MIRVGIGYDSHRLVEGRKLILGAVEIPFEKGLLGHSDGDVLLHAITDSIIGALGKGDIGKHFPDTDARWKDASSLKMFQMILTLAEESGYTVEMIDATIITEKPKLAPYIPEMVDRIENSGVGKGRVNIKAKTNEGMGFVGRGEGIVAMAVTTLRKR